MARQVLARHLAFALALLIGCSACGGRELAFVQDRGVAIVAPAQGEPVELPFELRWDNQVPDRYFAVFVDRTPMRPGEDLLSLVPLGDPCRPDPGCPDIPWLREQHVYVTDRDWVLIERLPRTGDRSGRRSVHEIIVVLLDEEGRRVSESAWVREVILERDSV